MSSVRVLDHDIEIVFISESEWGREAYGDFDCHAIKIRMMKGLTYPGFVTTLFHELTHFKQYIFGLDLNEDEANRDGLFWFSLLRGSPLLSRLWAEYNE